MRTEVIANAEGYIKQGLREEILRKAEILVDTDVDVTKIWPPERINKNIRIEPIDDGRTVFGQPDRQILVSAYSYPKGFRYYKNKATGIPTKTEIHAVIILNESSSLSFALDELETGEMMLEFYSTDLTRKGRFFEGFERPASLTDLQIFDKLLDSAVSKVLGDEFSKLEDNQNSTNFSSRLSLLT